MDGNEKEGGRSRASSKAGGRDEKTSMEQTPRTSSPPRRPRGVRLVCRLIPVATALALAGCGAKLVHVKPGQSARLSLAQIPVVLPSVVPGTPEHAMAGGSGAGPRWAGPAHFDRGVPLPERGDMDASSVGELAMRAGNNAAAIAAFEEVVKADPASVHAWERLVQLYERNGENEKAAKAYKRLKSLGLPNGTSGGSKVDDLLGHW
jgi:hypothetical protein